MKGKVDLTRILDLIFNPTPEHDAIGEVFLFFGHFFINAGSVEARPCPIPMDKPSICLAPSSIIHPSSPVPESPSGGLALFLILNSSLILSSAAFIVDEDLR